MKNIVIAALAAFVLVSCNNSETTTTETTTPETNAANNTVTPTGSEPTFTFDNNSAAAPATGNAPAGSAASGKLNPPHGEPGHRCEIPVGAPLDSPPTGNDANKISTNINNTPTGNTTTPTFTMQAPTTPAPATTGSGQPAKTLTAPGMNPPHGEPGHDCAIPVGQPLKK
jgi:hypothetical protein